MQAAADAVAAPDEDEPAFGEMLHAHAQLAAIGQVQGLAPGAGADGAVQQRGAELVEEAPVHALALHQAHGACVAVGQDGFGIARRQGLQARGDVGQRLVPAHGLELPGTLGSHAAQRGEHTLGVVAALGVLLTLAQSTPPVCGWAGLPWTLLAMPSSTVVTSEQVSGQSWGQAPSTCEVAWTGGVAGDMGAGGSDRGGTLRKNGEKDWKGVV